MIRPLCYIKDLLAAPRKLRILEERIHGQELVLKERTELHADIAWHRKADNLIIAVGRYKGRDYVQTFSVSVDSLAEMIEILRRWEDRYGHVRTLDAPPGFRAVFENERRR